MSKGAGVAIELISVGGLFLGAIACTLSSLSKQPYDLVEVRFCPLSANGENTKEQIELDKQYCSIPRFLLKEDWDLRGYYGSRVPLRDDVRLKNFLPSDNPNQHWALTGTALCLATISGVIAVRNELLNRKYYQWVEEMKTAGFDKWTEEKSVRDLTAFKRQLSTQFWADVSTAKDNERRIDSGLTNTERLNLEQQLEDNLNMTQYDLMIAQLRRKIAEEKLGETKADKESEKLSKTKDKPEKEDITQPSTNKKLELEESYQWIYKLLKLPFRVLSGEQGSGKSTLERLMIRLLKDDGWYVVVVNPETNPAVWSGVKVLADAEEINDFFQQFPETIKSRQQEARQLKIDEDDYLDTIRDRRGLNGKVAVFLMETNTYEVHGVDAQIWADFLKQSLTNIRKWGYTVCLTAHSDNQTSVSSKLKGFSALINSAPRVDCISKAGLDGEAVSSGKAWLKMKGVDDKEPLEVELYHYPKSKNFGDDEPLEQEEPTNEDTDWEEEILKWGNNLKRRPTPAEIKTKFKELTNLELNQEGAQDILKLLVYDD
ncbi:hypothetical protein BZZ01_04550 [Nostocales cyanobacterium HT-58-2]|nr:hypothetical protein BZZ01_04550 [Nostocales cyanobacterium HT-58-2]